MDEAGAFRRNVLQLVEDALGAIACKSTSVRPAARALRQSAPCDTLVTPRELPGGSRMGVSLWVRHRFLNAHTLARLPIRLIGGP